MKKIIYIFLALSLILLFSCNNQNDTKNSSNSLNNIVIPYGFIGAVGEGYGKTDVESEDIARKDALRKISEQIAVEIQTDTTLKQTLDQIIQDNEIKETAKTELENIIKTQTNIELVGVDFTLVDKRLENGMYYTKVLGLLDKEIALNTYRIFFALKLSQSLLENKMIYTAQKIVSEYEELLNKNKNKLPANMISNLTVVISHIKDNWSKVNSIYQELEKKEVNNLEDALRVLEGIDRIKDYSIDFPNDMINNLKEKVRPFVKNLEIEISGPNNVAVGMRVDLKINVNPSITGNYVFRVKANNADFPESVTIENGHGVLSGVVKDKNMWVELSLGEMIVKRFSPGTTEGAGVSSQITEELIRISAEGAGSNRDEAVEKALILAIKKAIGIVFSQDVNMLLSIPVDRELLNALFGILKYEIINENIRDKIYHVVLNVSVNKDEFKNLVVKIISEKPLGYAVIIVNNDQYAYIEPIFENKFLESGIKLVSKEYSEKLAQYSEYSDPSVLSKLALLSAAKYVVNIKVNYGETYASDYKLWSMRLFLNVQIVNTLTGQIVKSEVFEDVAAGATSESALSKILNGNKFKEFVSKIIDELKKPYSTDINDNKEREVRLTFYYERTTYILILKDYLSKKFEGVKLLDKDDKKGILIIKTNISPEEIINIVKSFPSLYIKVLNIQNNNIEFEIE